MDLKTMEQYFSDTAYIRMGGSAEELKCAKYLKEQCEKLGGEAYLEEFEVDMADIKEAHLFVDGQEMFLVDRLAGVVRIAGKNYADMNSLL
jgi:hypothetical protein